MHPPERTREHNEPVGELWCDEYLDTMAKPALIYANYGDEQEQRSTPANTCVDAWESEKCVELGVYFGPLKVAEIDCFHLVMTPQQARSIAYSLLWHANDIEDPAAWKKRPTLERKTTDEGS
jgi:hypothetical protein